MGDGRGARRGREPSAPAATEVAPSRGRLALLMVVVVLLLAAGFLLVPHDAERIREAVDGAGTLAPVAFVAAGALLALSFFPFPVVAAAGGLLFGVAAGTALSLFAETLGAAGALLLARHGARGWTGRLAGPKLTAVLAGIARRGFSAVLLVRVLPGLPAHPANYAFGLTTVSLSAFVPATVLGTAPRALAYAALGGTLGDLTSPTSLAAVGGLAAFGALGLWLAARDPEVRGGLRALRRSTRRRPSTAPRSSLRAVTTARAGLERDARAAEGAPRGPD